MDYLQLQKETIQSEENLLAQYKLELRNLQERKGIARTMSNSEISVAMKQLEEAIRSKELSLRSMKENENW